jgi:hypothetical protein
MVLKKLCLAGRQIDKKQREAAVDETNRGKLFRDQGFLSVGRPLGRERENMTKI